MKLLFLSGLFVVIAFFSQTCFAEKPYLDGYRMGITFRQLVVGNFKIGDIPFIDARIPLVLKIVSESSSNDKGSKFNL